MWPNLVGFARGGLLLPFWPGLRSAGGQQRVNVRSVPGAAKVGCPGLFVAVRRP
jgi:hypothetical protein